MHHMHIFRINFPIHFVKATRISLLLDHRMPPHNIPSHCNRGSASKTQLQLGWGIKLRQSVYTE